MTTKGVIGTKFPGDDKIRGMYVNGDGLPETIAETIWKNFRLRFNGDLKRLMERIYEEPYFYFDMAYADFSLPNVYFGMSSYAREFDKEYPSRAVYKPTKHWADLFSKDARAKVLVYIKSVGGFNMHPLEVPYALAARAPESASACEEYVEELAAEPRVDYRHQDQQSGLEEDDYTVIVDIERGIISWCDLDKDDEEVRIEFPVSSEVNPTEWCFQQGIWERGE